MTVSHADSTGTLTYPGIVQEMHTINVAFKTAGQLANINVKEGDYIKEGQLIASLDDADYKLGVEALQIQYDQVSDEVSRMRELYKNKSLSANDYEK
ncbi:MAG TPA: efflux RND transporter periplasmic adaptor subunit, partial [Rikenellaceae bacterium]|nr:efflux RND transporter periplasmic adaptor subunit [Rikenellaceae bacterium]